MKEDAYLICKLIDGVYVPQTAPIVITGTILSLDDLKNFAANEDSIVVVLKSK